MHFPKIPPSLPKKADKYAEHHEISGGPCFGATLFQHLPVSERVSGRHVRPDNPPSRPINISSNISPPQPTVIHRWELPGNYPVFTVVMVIYHYVERIWRILVTPIF